MFPAKLAHYFIQRYSRPSDVVLDPFSGRGTVPLQARVEGRKAISNDLNPLAYVLSLAKSSPPSWQAINQYLNNIEKRYARSVKSEPAVSEDIRMLYHPNTLAQIWYIRKYLLRRPLQEWSPEAAMIAGCLAGIMHGSHRRDGTSQYLSISMPNTFSMSPMYVKKFIAEKKLVAPDQDVFERLRDKLARLYLDGTDGPEGQVFYEDGPKLMSSDTHLQPGSVDLVVTSPPYLQVVNYGTANWIRLWLLGMAGVGRERGKGRKTLDKKLDHRHAYDAYKEFMLRTFVGIERVLKRDGVAAVVIGNVADPGKEAVPLAQKIWDDIGSQTNLRLVTLIEDELAVTKKVSRIWGDTKGQATDRDFILVLAKKNGRPSVYTEEADWDEPYKDGGPDAAHTRLRARFGDVANGDV
jgi:site-specific DNA-methyltransferase (adenine-specific)